MTKALVIGYGSELRGDDRLGPLAARQLAAQTDDPDVRILERPSLTPELASDLAEAAFAIFIDCSQEGPPGVIVVSPLTAPDPHSVALVHFLDPPALIGWTRLLYGRAPQAVTVSVAGTTFEFGDRLSAGLEAVLPQVVERVASLLDAFAVEAVRSA